MPIAHRLLTIVYLVAPLIACVGLGWQARRQRRFAPLVGLGFTVVSATLIAGTFCLLLAFLTASHVSAGQVCLAIYLLFGVLCILKGFSWLLKQGLEYLVGVHPRQAAAYPRSAWWASRMAAAILLRICLLFGLGLPYLMSLVLVYRPKVIPVDTPTEILGARYESVQFMSTDGVRLSGWWIPAQRQRNTDQPDPEWGRKTVILCHGLGAGKANQLALARELSPNGYNILAFDFRAHGESDGQITTFGALESNDVLGAVRWVRGEHPDECRQLDGLGVSMGAAALIRAAASPTDEGRALNAIAVLSTYDSLSGLAQTLADQYLATPLDWIGMNVGLPLISLHAGIDLRSIVPVKDIEAISPRPVFVLHGRGDEIIPFDAGVRLFEAASQPKLRLWVGRLNTENEWVLPTDQKSTAENEGTPADHNNMIFYDDAARAVRLFFEAQRAML